VSGSVRVLCCSRAGANTRFFAERAVGGGVLCGTVLGNAVLLPWSAELVVVLPVSLRPDDE
jgi:hypothetical protein